MSEYKKKGKTTAVTTNEFGKLLPQNVEFEENIIGSLMKYFEDTEYLDKAIKFLRPEVFYKIAHQKIFEAIYELYRDDKPYDVLSVTQLLRHKGTIDECGGAYYVTLIMQKGYTLTTIEFHSAYIFECYIRRCVIKLLTEKISQLYDEKIDIVDIYESLHT